MKKSEKKLVSKFMKNFEIGKSAQLNIMGGTKPHEEATTYWLDGDQACSFRCPDSRIDIVG
jgi:hypothetical protein